MSSFQLQTVTDGSLQIVVFILLVILYHMKSQGLNPMRWYWSPTMDLSNPTRVASSRNRRGRFPRFRAGRPVENIRLLWKFVWDWLR